MIMFLHTSYCRTRFVHPWSVVQKVQNRIISGQNTGGILCRLMELRGAMSNWNLSRYGLQRLPIVAERTELIYILATKGWLSAGMNTSLHVAHVGAELRYLGGRWSKGWDLRFNKGVDFSRTPERYMFLRQPTSPCFPPQILCTCGPRSERYEGQSIAFFSALIGTVWKFGLLELDGRAALTLLLLMEECGCTTSSCKRTRPSIHVTMKHFYPAHINTRRIHQPHHGSSA